MGLVRDGYRFPKEVVRVLCLLNGLLAAGTLILERVKHLTGRGRCVGVQHFDLIIGLYPCAFVRFKLSRPGDLGGVSIAITLSPREVLVKKLVSEVNVVKVLLSPIVCSDRPHTSFLADWRSR